MIFQTCFKNSKRLLVYTFSIFLILSGQVTAKEKDKHKVTEELDASVVNAFEFDENHERKKDRKDKKDKGDAKGSPLYSSASTTEDTGTNETIVNKSILEKINVNHTITPETTDLVGEKIDLNTGTLSFSQTDISLPGNFDIPVEITRTFKSSDFSYSRTLEMGDWIIDVPHIHTTLLKGASGYSGAWGDGIACSGELNPGEFLAYSGIMVMSSEYWNGTSLNVPNRSGGKLLRSNGYLASNIEYPNVTTSNWKISCFDSIDGEKEGFIAHAPNGDKYTFDKLHLVQTDPLIKDKSIARYNAFMLVTKIEDKFGNTVTYNYGPDGLESISASDGRLIEIFYENYRVSYITANGRRWDYSYSTDNEHLQKVTLPDDTYWTFTLGAIGNAKGKLVANSEGQTGDNCYQALTQSWTGSIKHPNGLLASFTLESRRFGRSNVDRSQDSISQQDYTRRCFGAASLTSKTLSGAGISDLTWSYHYSQKEGYWDSDTVTVDNQLTGTIPVQIDAHNYRRTTVTAPDLSITKYYHNRDYSSAFDGRLAAVQNYDVNNGGLLQETVYEYEMGEVLGFSWLTNENIFVHNYQTYKQQETVKSLDDTYTTKYGDVNTYGLARKTIESHSVNSSVKTVKQVQRTFVHDTDNWSINLPFKTYVAESSDMQYVPTEDDLVSETSYKTVSFTDTDNVARSVLVPEFQKSFGVWQKKYSEYYTTQGSYQQLGQLKKIEFNAPLYSDNTKNRYKLFENYNRGQAQKISVPKRRSTGTDFVLRTIDNNGWVTSITDFNGNQTSYGYDDLGRINYIKAPDKTGEVDWADTFFTWSNSGGNGADQPVRKIERCTLNATKTACDDSPLMTETTTYDGLLRPILVKTEDGTGDGSNTVYKKSEYNAYNKPTFQSFPSTSETETDGTTYGYDGLQRLTSQSMTGGGVITTEYLAGNKIKVTDAGKNAANTRHSTTTTYLAYGSPTYEQAIKIESPESVTTTTIDINLYGNINSITQSGKRGLTTITATENHYYNNQQQLCAVKRDDVGSTVYQRNNLGQVEWQAEGQILAADNECNTSVSANDKVSFTYDSLGEIYQTSFGDSTPTRTYGYDDNGNITSIVGAVSQSYTYNAINLLESEMLTVDGKTFALDYGYSKLGHLASLVYPDNIEKIDFEPNGFGQATQAIRTYDDTNKGVDTFVEADASYHPNGIVDTFTYGNGLTHKTTMNTRLMPQQIRDYKTGTDAVNLSYTYDNNANITSITNGRAAELSTLSALTYDGLNRLTSTTGEASIGSSSLSYDGLGNISAYSNNSIINSHDLTYHYDANHLLTSVKVKDTETKVRDFSQTSSYDRRGNVLTNGERNFIYNLANQMIASDNNTYTYDGYNRRVKIQDSKGTSYSMYSQSGQLLYRETEMGGVNYVFLGSKLVAKEGTGVRPINEGASETSIANYKPFGDIIERNGDDYHDNRDEVGYTGHKFDTDLGLSYMQARYYDPVIGRFYSNDPVGYTSANPVMSFNRYMYANNNPYKYTDPDGKFIWHAVGAIAGGGFNAIAQGVTKGFDNIDYSQVAVAAAVGATGVGLANSITRSIAQAGLSGGGAVTASIAGNGVAGSALNVTGTLTNAAIDGLQGDTDGTVSGSQLAGAAKDGLIFGAGGTATAKGVTSLVKGATGNLLGKAKELTPVGIGIAESAGNTVSNLGDLKNAVVEKVEKLLE